MPNLRALIRELRELREGAQSEFTSADLMFWQQSQVRIAGYLTTNGLIQISLCGLFATTSGVLAALGQSLISKHDVTVFSIVIPIFGMAALVLSTNVYCWMEAQHAYLAIMGRHPRHLREMCTYEEYKRRLFECWDKMPLRQRFWKTTSQSGMALPLAPFRLKDIYHFYFFMYVATALGSEVYAYFHGAPWWYVLVVAVIAWLILGIETHEVTKIRCSIAEVNSVLI